MTIFMIMTLILFIMSNHPFLMILLLMMITLWTSILIYYSLLTSWFSYVLLIILLSGVMIIFMYMATLSPNESFMYSFFPLIIFPMMIITYIPNQFVNTPQLWSMKQVSSYFYPLTIIMVMFLFMVMVAITKITFWQKGPMSLS
uniref:NADH dehydrogenase subunit 6 n=1 Tax=Songthela hangzhouensis TaxID=1649374 RepID=Q6JT35_9ARAC|nr:NADH dehydrogenase subunit 6 [Songthela hangzhouensis]AAP51143.1 NADH dehydrogenase subunit 6 [Songthela hangzhouensis]